MSYFEKHTITSQPLSKESINIIVKLEFCEVS